jgi:two-component system OmpR family sensor kinase
MRPLRSLQGRVALAIGIGVTLLWIAAATVTATILRHEMDEVFDSALEETAQRILPLAVLDVLGREEQGLSQRIATLRQHEEYFTYLVRDAEGRVLLRSHGADDGAFPPYRRPGFRQTATHRLYYDAALQETITIAVAEPLEHRAAVAREMQLGLALPLLLVVPLSLTAIFGVVRISLRPIRRLGNEIAARNVQNLAPVQDAGLPNELEPIAGAVNELLGRLYAAFEAERSFAANTAHELRTPLAGAIAQAQRLLAETTDPQAARRAGEIENTLKRLARLSEKLLQLARAEGGRLRTGQITDVRLVLRAIVDDLERSAAPGRLKVALPSDPVLSDIDPDAFGILCRNLIENALKYGAADTPIHVQLALDGRFSVANDGPVLSPDTLQRLTSRFERAATRTDDGSGLGLAIVRTIAERADGSLVLRSPIPGRGTGFEAVVTLPTARAPI